MQEDQKQYFVRRLNEIAREKVRAKAVELFGESGRPEQPTWGAVFAAIKAGEITLKEGTEDSTRAFLNPSDVVWPAMDAKKQALVDYEAVINAEKQKAMDAVYLDSSAQEALSAFQGI